MKDGRHAITRQRRRDIEGAVRVIMGTVNTDYGFDSNAPVLECEPEACSANLNGHQPIGITWEQIAQDRKIPEGTRCSCGKILILV